MKTLTNRGIRCLVCIFSLAFFTFVHAADNLIYITQSGGSSGLTMNIDQVGNSNAVGTSSARVSLTGTGMTVDIDQLGDSNVIAATVAQGNSTSFTLRAIQRQRQPLMRILKSPELQTILPRLVT